MPQFTHFPRLPAGEYRAAVESVLRALRDMPAEGEPFKAFRARLKRVGLWSREGLPHLLRFLRMAHSDPMIPSPLMRALAEAPGLDEAREVLVRRLWEVNPLLFKVVLERIEERVHSANEVLKYVDSFAYPGNRISGPDVRAWVALAQGLGMFQPVGIRLGLTPMAKKWLPKVHALDIDEFLDDDADEPPVPMPKAPEAAAPAPAEPSAPASAAPDAAPAPRPAAPAAGPLPGPALVAPSAVEGPSPLGRGRPVPIARFTGHGVFADDVLDITRERVAEWWTERQSSGLTEPPEPAEGAPSPEDWMEDPPRALFRAAVRAALEGQGRRTPEAAAAAFAELDRAGVLDALHDGTAPESAPAITDAGALMLASVIARRCAEHPELPADLERCKSAADAYARLDEALGRGLLGVELFHLMALLGSAGGVPTDGLADFVARPDRGVRDTLYRLGFTERPYATDAADRAVAAAAARRAVPSVPRADVVLRAFAARAGCAYACPRRRQCDLPCRERTDPG